MLNELDVLAQKISRLILLNSQYQQTQRHLTQQLAQLHAQLNGMQSALEQACQERDALRTECNSLTDTLDTARTYLCALIEKLPSLSTHSAEVSVPVEECMDGENI